MTREAFELTASRSDGPYDVSTLFIIIIIIIINNKKLIKADRPAP